MVVTVTDTGIPSAPAPSQLPAGAAKGSHRLQLLAQLGLTNCRRRELDKLFLGSEGQLSTLRSENTLGKFRGKRDKCLEIGAK